MHLIPDNAFPVLYLPKKYMLNNLIGTVLKFIASADTGQTIAKVLPDLHLMRETMRQGWSYISGDVVNYNNFVSDRQSTRIEQPRLLGRQNSFNSVTPSPLNFFGAI